MRPDRTSSAAIGATGQRSAVDVPRGDEDDDETGEKIGNTRNDYDEDFDNDFKQQPRTYYDSDDGGVRGYGVAPASSVRKTLAAIVQRYFTAARSGDGRAACSLLTANFARAVPEDYGRPPGPADLRGSTCAAVMKRLFKLLHEELAGGIVVADVRVAGSAALVLVGSSNQPAGEVRFLRKGSRWGIVGLLATPLP
ncbi:MAG TPA: hypothetical protein VFW38_11435 [Solirubrobacteraceae bacterium]|nr:hypothetical protein [Solirubrobacteraceae bacterium]